MNERRDAIQAAMAAFLAGRENDTLDILTQEHNREVARGDVVAAARAAFWLSFTLIGTGDRARSAGWAARSRRLLDEHGRDCVEAGYVLLPQALDRVAAGDLRTAATLFADADRVGCRFGDRDLSSLARQGHGRALVALGQVAEGVALFDEVMVAATAGELKPFVAGVVYCSVISACFDLCDLRRAQEWTAALKDWCDAQPTLVLYRGECQAHRAEILRLHGQWADALEEAQRAYNSLPSDRRGPRGAAMYEIAELHRLRGDFAEAAASYERASEYGRSPHPGLALLRLAQGRVDAARAAIMRALAEPAHGRQCYVMRAAGVAILLAGGDVESARALARELSGRVTPDDPPLLKGLAAYAEATVALAEHSPIQALAAARAALAIWRELDAPYEVARTTLVIADACQALGDADGARMEAVAATHLFEQLGAAPELSRLCDRESEAEVPGGLTGRELEVLRLVAHGESNREIAEHLAISEKTVARHLSNIFSKLDLPSRSAATAFAFKNRLVH